jgi:glutathione S-transferase
MLGDKLLEVGHDIEVEHAPAEREQHVRSRLRAGRGAPLRGENVWGQTQSDEYKARVPSGLTPSVETEGLPKGALWESCAVMMYLASREGLTSLYPTDLERRAMVDSANFYTMSILYPLVARATYPRLSFSGYPGEVSMSDATDEGKETARKAAEEAIPAILEVYKTFFLADSPFIGGDEPSIALGDAYSEPAGDVRGYIAQVSGEAVAS